MSTPPKPNFLCLDSQKAPQKNATSSDELFGLIAGTRLEWKNPRRNCTEPKRSQAEEHNGAQCKSGHSKHIKSHSRSRRTYAKIPEKMRHLFLFFQKAFPLPQRPPFAQKRSGNRIRFGAFRALSNYRELPAAGVCVLRCTALHFRREYPAALAYLVSARACSFIHKYRGLVRAFSRKGSMKNSGAKNNWMNFFQFAIYFIHTANVMIKCGNTLNGKIFVICKFINLNSKLCK